MKKHKTTFTMDLQNSKMLYTKYNQSGSSSFKKKFIKLWWRNSSDKGKVYEGWLPITFHWESSEFQKGKGSADKSFIVPKSLFQIKKPVLSNEIIYYRLTENE